MSVIACLQETYTLARFSEGKKVYTDFLQLIPCVEKARTWLMCVMMGKPARKASAFSGSHWHVNIVCIIIVSRIFVFMYFVGKKVTNITTMTWTQNHGRFNLLLKHIGLKKMVERLNQWCSSSPTHINVSPGLKDNLFVVLISAGCLPNPQDVYPNCTANDFVGMDWSDPIRFYLVSISIALLRNAHQFSNRYRTLSISCGIFLRTSLKIRLTARP